MVEESGLPFSGAVVAFAKDHMKKYPLNMKIDP